MTITIIFVEISTGFLVLKLKKGFCHWTWYKDCAFRTKFDVQLLCVRSISISSSRSYDDLSFKKYDMPNQLFVQKFVRNFICFETEVVV